MNVAYMYNSLMHCIFKTGMGLFFLLQLFFVVAYWTFNPAFECITQCKLLQFMYGDLQMVG